MSHNQYSRRPALWTSTSVPTAKDLGTWDRAQYSALDGVNGGSWSPKTPIVIGGAGLILSGTAGKIYGGVSTSTGGRFVHGGNDYVQLNPIVSRVETMNTLGMTHPVNGPPFSVSASPLGIVAQDSPLLVIPSRYLHQDAGIYSVSVTGIAQSQPTGSAPYNIQAQLLLIQQNGLEDVQVIPPPLDGGSMWGSGNTYFPFNLVIPLGGQNGFFFRAISVGGSGGIGGATQPVWPTTLGATVIDNPGANQIVWECVGYSGYNTTGATAAACFNGGNPQTLTMSSDYYLSGLYTVDTTSLTYAIQINDAGTNVAWNWTSVSISYSGITSLLPE